MASFEYNGEEYSADGIAAVVNAGVNEVQVRYSDGRPPVILRGTSAGHIIGKVSAAKSKRR